MMTLLAENSKNGEARKIPLEGELWEIMERRWEARAHKGSDSEVVMSPLVFHRRTLTARGQGQRKKEGQQIRDFSKAWKSACETAKIGKRHFHDFRRSAARNMRRAGVSEEVAMKITGHKTNAMFKRYNITDEKDIREL